MDHDFDALLLASRKGNEIMKKIALGIMFVMLTSCRPVHSMGGHITCKPVLLPTNVKGWDYVGRSATDSGFGEWYDRQGNLFGYASEEDSTIYRNVKCLHPQPDHDVRFLVT